MARALVGIVGRESVIVVRKSVIDCDKKMLTAQSGKLQRRSGSIEPDRRQTTMHEMAGRRDVW
jgi:hypothetical protein